MKDTRVGPVVGVVSEEESSPLLKEMNTESGLTPVERDVKSIQENVLGGVVCTRTVSVWKEGGHVVVMGVHVGVVNIKGVVPLIPPVPLP